MEKSFLKSLVKSRGTHLSLLGLLSKCAQMGVAAETSVLQRGLVPGWWQLLSVTWHDGYYCTRNLALLCSVESESRGFRGLGSEWRLTLCALLPSVLLDVSSHMAGGITCCVEAPTGCALSTFPFSSVVQLLVFKSS